MIDNITIVNQLPNYFKTKNFFQFSKNIIGLNKNERNSDFLLFLTKFYKNILSIVQPI